MRRAGSARALRALPCLLLVAVASHQIALSHLSGLSPWSGGGFGMFSTTDAGSTRHLHTVTIRPGLRREIPEHRLPEDLVDRALVLPSERNLEHIATAALSIRTQDHGPPTAVEVQVWHTRYDSDDRTPTSRLLRGLTVPIGED